MFAVKVLLSVASLVFRMGVASETLTVVETLPVAELHVEGSCLQGFQLKNRERLRSESFRLHRYLVADRWAENRYDRLPLSPMPR